MAVSRKLLAVVVFGGLAAFAGVPARAQMGAGPGGQAGFQPPFKDQRGQVKPPEPRPAALPGATPGLGAAPADKTTADVPPNEALFDAINRGDIGGARDALNRGAELNAQNVLGMTPLELSVDLSRNDITFMLLSMRGYSGRPGKAPVAAAATAPPPPKPPARRVALTAKASAAPPVPRQYAGPADPGTPAPQVGFLGFGRVVQ